LSNALGPRLERLVRRWNDWLDVKMTVEVLKLT